MAGLTAMVASWKDIEELEVSPEECQDFGKALQDVLRHYSVEATQKGADFLTFAGVSGTIMATRITAYKLRKKMEAMERNGGNVHPFPNGAIHVGDFPNSA